MGMLSTAAYILAEDTFGPITDNAGGIIDSHNQPDEIRAKTDRLDGVGNTTGADQLRHRVSGVGGLPGSRRTSRRLLLVRSKLGVLFPNPDWAFNTINLAKVPGSWALLGAMLVYLFSSLAIKAGGQDGADRHRRGPQAVQREPGHHGTAKLDYGRCGSIGTGARPARDPSPGCWRWACPSRSG